MSTRDIGALTSLTRSNIGCAVPVSARDWSTGLGQLLVKHIQIKGWCYRRYVFSSASLDALHWACRLYFRTVGAGAPPYQGSNIPNQRHFATPGRPRRGWINQCHSLAWRSGLCFRCVRVPGCNINCSSKQGSCRGREFEGPVGN